MEYLYQPLFKYIAFVLILFLFIHQYKSIEQENYLVICITIVILVMMLDYFIIDKHPGLFEESSHKIYIETNENDNMDN